MSWVDLLLRNLFWTSLSGSLLIAGVWLLCRLAPRLPAGVRCTLWWLACAKLLVGLVWVAPVTLPLLPAPKGLAAPQDAVFLPLSPEGRAEGILAFLWLSAVAVQLGWVLAQVLRARGIVTRSARVGGWIAALFERLAARVGLPASPALRSSAEVESPQAVGLARPVVLLPERKLGLLSAQELEMTLCHELLHVRRRDLWLGWVPVLAQRLFFFHPLAAWAAREYALAREAACDAEVLHVLGSAPQAYGRLLLRLGVAPRETGLAAAGASPTLGNLKRRLHMLQQTSDAARRLSRWSWLAAAAAVLALVPIQMGAQAPPTPKPSKPPKAPRAAVETPTPPSPPAPPSTPAPPAAPSPPTAPAPPAPPAPAAPAAMAAPEAIPAPPAVAAPEAVPAPAPLPPVNAVPALEPPPTPEPPKAPAPPPTAHTGPTPRAHPVPAPAPGARTPKPTPPAQPAPPAPPAPPH